MAAPRMCLLLFLVIEKVSTGLPRVESCFVTKSRGDLL